MRYQNGEPQRKTPVDGWMTSNYVQCGNLKARFWLPEELPGNERLCQLDFQVHWPLVQELLNLVAWLAEGHSGPPDPESQGPPTEFGNSVPELWPLFVAQLKLASKEFSSRLDYMDALIDELQLEKQFLGLTRYSRSVVCCIFGLISSWRIVFLSPKGDYILGSFAVRRICSAGLLSRKLVKITVSWWVMNVAYV